MSEEEKPVDETQQEPPPPEQEEESLLWEALDRGNATLQALADQVTHVFGTVLEMLREGAAERKAFGETQRALETHLRRIDDRGVVFEGLLVLIILLTVSSTLQRLAVIDQHVYYGAVLVGGVLASGAILWRHPHNNDRR